MALNPRGSRADGARVHPDHDTDEPRDDLTAAAAPDGEPDDDDDDGEGIPLVAHAVAAALATSREERSWALNALAVELTTLGEHDEALEVLRASVKLGGSERSRAAALTCAVAVRCRQAQYDDAMRIGDVVLRSTGDVRLLRVVGRVFTESFGATGDDRLRDAARRHYERADLEETFDAS